MAPTTPISPVSARFVPLKVACFEGPWSSDMRDRQTVLHLLEFLEAAGWIRFFYRQAGTAEQFMDDVGKWARQARYREYEVAFIATHGEPGAVHLGADRVSIASDPGERSGADEHVYLAEELAGLLNGRIVYFGACEVAGDQRSKGKRRRDLETVLGSFRQKTRAKLVCGYTEPVDFAEAAAFEILLFTWLAEYKRRAYAIDLLVRDYRDLTDALGFVTSPRRRVRRRR